MEPYKFGWGDVWPGVVRRLLFVLAIPPALKAWEGISSRIVTTGYGWTKVEVVTGDEALHYGQFSLYWAAGFLVASFLVWYLWDRNTD